MHACMHTYVHTYIHTYIHTHTYNSQKLLTCMWMHTKLTVKHTANKTQSFPGNILKYFMIWSLVTLIDMGRSLALSPRNKTNKRPITSYTSLTPTAASEEISPLRVCISYNYIKSCHVIHISKDIECYVWCPEAHFGFSSEVAIMGQSVLD